MLKIYSKKCEYAIRALSSIRRDILGESFSLRSVCHQAKTPEWSTRKTFQALVHKGILVARSGPGGGYRFRVSPDRVSILKLILAVDGENAFEKCILGYAACGSHNPCALHEIWKKAKTTLVSELGSSSLARIMRKK